MDVIFNFKGAINNQILRSILQTMDEKMSAIGDDRFLRKKINSILIECLQNLIFHSEDADQPVHEPGLIISRKDNAYQIQTTNLVPKDKAAMLTTYIDRINQMDEHQLREYYQEVLTNGKFNPKGGAGLGLINIARKTKDRKIHYSFLPAEPNLLFQMFIVV
jgi:hypothetical protein